MLSRRRDRDSEDRQPRRRRSGSRSYSNEPNRQSGCLYVSNINTRAREQDLEDKFGEIGELERVMIVKNPYTKESRGFAFINFKAPEKAQEAIDKLNGEELLGNQLKIELAKRTEPRTKTPGKFMGPGRDGRDGNGRDGNYGRDGRPSYNSRYGRSDNRGYDRSDNRGYDRPDSRGYDRPRR